jgi:hypothetical protein
VQWCGNETGEPPFDLYNGDFKDDLFHGKGTLKRVSGEVYVGSWCRGLRHGTCRFRTGLPACTRPRHGEACVFSVPLSLCLSLSLSLCGEHLSVCGTLPRMVTQQSALGWVVFSPHVSLSATPPGVAWCRCGHRGRRRCRCCRCRRRRCHRRRCRAGAGEATNLEGRKGYSYKGQYLRGLHHGLGTLNNGAEGRYSGMWHLGLKHGAGRSDYSDGGFFVGIYKENVYHRGKLRTGNGDEYEGTFDAHGAWRAQAER